MIKNDNEIENQDGERETKQQHKLNEDNLKKKKKLVKRK